MYRSVLPNEASLSIDNNCFVSSKVPIADGLGKGIGLCVN